MTKPVLSLQLFSMRGLGDLGTQLDKAASAGFGAVEPLEAHLRDADLLQAGLARNGLTAPSAHIGLEALRSERQRFVNACQQCGIGQVFVPHSATLVGKDTKAAWQRTGVADSGRTSIGVALPDVEAASSRIAGLAVRTPVRRSSSLGERLGGARILKRETRPPAGAF